ncbi:MAG: 3',5'-cyclic-nucleotide phosphodiesterase [Burkholderiaceae bacterium]
MPPRTESQFHMQVRVLGCSGSIAAGSRTTAFALDHDVLLDAGTGVGELSLEELGRIDHILLSHSHLDHVLAIGLLADSVIRSRVGRPPIQVHALPDTIAALRAHIFNGVIWPDFTRLPTADAPVLQLVPFEVGQIITLGERRIEVLPAAHTVPAVGFAVLGAPVAKRGAFIYTGDTGPNPALWARLHGMRISSLVIETAFRDDERQLARVSRHLCPSALGQELSRLDHPVNVFITHIKPGELDVVMSEIAALGSAHRIRALTHGQVIAVD